VPHFPVTLPYHAPEVSQVTATFFRPPI
jgi:hypothetical protein